MRIHIVISEGDGKLYLLELETNFRDGKNVYFTIFSKKKRGVHESCPKKI